MKRDHVVLYCGSVLESTHFYAVCDTALFMCMYISNV